MITAGMLIQFNPITFWNVQPEIDLLKLIKISQSYRGIKVKL